MPVLLGWTLGRFARAAVSNAAARCSAAWLFCCRRRAPWPLPFTQCSLNSDVALVPSPACRRLQNDLQKLIEQHKDVQHAPAAPTLVRLEVRLGWRRGEGQGGTIAMGVGGRGHALCTHGTLSGCCC